MNAIKKYKVLIILAVVTLIIDIVLIMMWMTKSDETEKARKLMQDLQKKAEGINKFDYQINQENVDTSANNLAEAEKSKNEIKSNLSKQFQVSHTYNSQMGRSEAKDTIIENVEKLIKKLDGKNIKVGDKLSFDKYFEDLPNKKHIDTLFKHLTIISYITDQALKAQVEEIVKIERPVPDGGEEVGAADSKNASKTKFIITITGKESSVKKFANLIKESPKYFFTTRMETWDAVTEITEADKTDNIKDDTEEKIDLDNEKKEEKKATKNKVAFLSNNPTLTLEVELFEFKGVK